MISLAGGFVHPELGFTLDALTLGRHLGRVCRFGGSVQSWWSVLHHSLFVEQMMANDGLEPSLRLAGLLHDAHEFIRGDVPTAWKTPADAIVERRIDSLIANALGVPDFASAPAVVEVVKRYDREALIVEANVVAPVCAGKMPEKFSDEPLVAKRRPVIQEFLAPITSSNDFAWAWAESQWPTVFALTFQGLKESL